MSEYEYYVGDPCYVIDRDFAKPYGPRKQRARRPDTVDTTTRSLSLGMVKR